MKALFICHVRRDADNVAYPAIEDVRNGVGGTFPCRWQITTFLDARRLAVGICDVTPAQLVLIDAESDIRTHQLPDGWRALLWRDVPLVKRQALLAFLAAKGVPAPPGDNPTLLQVVNWLCDSCRPGSKADYVENL